MVSPSSLSRALSLTGWLAGRPFCALPLHGGPGLQATHLFLVAHFLFNLVLCLACRHDRCQLHSFFITAHPACKFSAAINTRTYPVESKSAYIDHEGTRAVWRKYAEGFIRSIFAPPAATVHARAEYSHCKQQYDMCADSPIPLPP